MADWKLPYDDLKFNRQIGKGNFGEVYEGEYLGTRVAIKKLFFVDDDFMQKYIEREMDTLTGLAHPNIVQLIGLCIETDDMYIVTEFINGGDLRSKLKDTTIPMDWQTRLGIARDVALAMSYLHSKNIMHRDLKSHNLLVGEGWKIKVCDFGLARSAPSEGEDTNLMTIVGTNEWMAPEVAMGEKYDKSADVFSYAMVLYEIITREKPPQRKIKDMYAFIAEDQKANIPKETPPELWNLLVDCAAMKTDARPTFKEVVKRLLNLIKDFETSNPGAVVKSPAAGAGASKANGASAKEEAAAAAAAAKDGKDASSKKKPSSKSKKKKSSKDGTSEKSTKKKSSSSGEKKKKKPSSSSSGDGATAEKKPRKKRTKEPSGEKSSTSSSSSSKKRTSKKSSSKDSTSSSGKEKTSSSSSSSKKKTSKS